jgi:hypothetical protein
MAQTVSALTILTDVDARRTGFEYAKVEQPFPSRNITAASSAGKVK